MFFGFSAGFFPGATYGEATCVAQFGPDPAAWPSFNGAPCTVFDKFVEEWGNKNGVKVRVDRIPHLELPSRLAAEFAAGRGHDLVLLEVSPEPHLAPPDDATDRLALRLWRLQRADLWSRFERLGVAVASLDDDTTVEAALEGVKSYRRHARLARR